MKKTEFYAGILAFGLLSVSCEDRIDIDLNAAAPRVVIEADLDDLYAHLPKPPEKGEEEEGGFPPGEDGDGWADGKEEDSKQFIYVSRSVAFNDLRFREVVADATVEVEEVETGKKFPFVREAHGNSEDRYGNDPLFFSPYVSETFAPVEGHSYTLRVWVDGQLYASTETMPRYIEVDSISAERDDLFGDDLYYGVFEFRDPPYETNYYLYSEYHGYRSQTSFRDIRVYSDKFNDGRKAVHRFEVSIWGSGAGGGPAHASRVKRQLISPAVAHYWREARSINPAATAPANPKSNISNGALGFFSVSSARVYDVDLTEVYRP